MKEHWISLADAEVHALDWEPARPTGAPPVVLLHGLGGSTLNWELVGGSLADALGARVRALDLAGFGRTRAPARPATVSANRALVAEVLRADGPAVLVGNSMGGAISLAVASRHPELVSLLVLVDPALPPVLPRLPGVDWGFVGRFAGAALPGFGGRALALRARRLGPARVVEEQLRLVLADPSRVPRDLREKMITLAGERAHLVDAGRAFSEAARSLVRYLSGPFRRDAGAAPGPLLVVHGDRDRLVPLASARAFAARRPDVHVEVLAACGHVPQLEHPERFVEVVAGWVRAHTRPAPSTRRATR